MGTIHTCCLIQVPLNYKVKGRIRNSFSLKEMEASNYYSMASAKRINQHTNPETQKYPYSTYVCVSKPALYVGLQHLFPLFDFTCPNSSFPPFSKIKHFSFV